MATPDELEIYKQRYETYRHLDRLRWQMLQIAVGAGLLTLAFAKDGAKPNWWLFAVVGTMLIIFGLVMLRIGHGIKMNGQVLSKAAALVGDADIPPVSTWWKSVSFWIASTLIVVGVVFIGLAYLSLRMTNGVGTNA